MQPVVPSWLRRHPVISVIFGVFLFLVVLGMIGGSGGQQNSNPSSHLASSSQPIASSAPKTEEQLLTDVGQVALTYTGSTTAAEYKGVEIQNDDPDRPTGSKLVTISFNVSEVFTKSSLLRDTGKVSANAFQGIFAENPKIYDAIVWYYGNTTDRYGNTKNDVILTYAMDRGTFNKINWPNFDSTNLCDFLIQEDKLTGRNFNTGCVTLVNIQ